MSSKGPTPDRPTWTTTRKAVDAGRLLAAAEALGLPEPKGVDVGPHDMLGIHLVLGDEWGYAAWLDMLDRPECRDFARGGAHYRAASGHWGDVHVEMQVATPLRRGWSA